MAKTHRVSNRHRVQGDFDVTIIEGHFAPGRVIILLPAGRRLRRHADAEIGGGETIDGIAFASAQRVVPSHSAWSKPSAFFRLRFIFNLQR